MSKKPSHIPVFPDAYHRDTTHLTTEEHGAYFLLMMAAWGSDDCTLPNDDKRLAALVKMPVAKWKKIAPTVLEFWTIDKGRISQKRLLKEWHYVQQTRGKRKAAAEARWSHEDVSKCNANGYPNGMHLGGGGGGGALSKDRSSFSTLEDDGPFSVISGGRP
jgi:uncharacterized protein YdaU (DUF1376 family)